MAVAEEPQGRNLTVLAVSRYGTCWLVDARTGAVRWQLVNGNHPGAIDHGGELIYVTYASGPIRRDTRTPPDWGDRLRIRTNEERRQYQELLVSSAELLALRAKDGAVTWRIEGWVGHNPPPLLLRGGHQLDGNLVITEVTDFAEATPVISALDARTSVVRWRYVDTNAREISHGLPTIRLLGTSAGRVYVWQPLESRIAVLDTASGQLLWSCEHTTGSEWHLSQGGLLLAELGGGDWDRGTDRSLVIRRTSDGQVTGRLSAPLLSHFLGLTDAGIAYLTGRPNWHKWVEALDTGTAEPRWRAERPAPLLSTDRDIGLFSTALAARSSLYLAQLNDSSGLAEVLSLDAQNGRQRWRWHSPSHLLALLQLWGWRTPRVIVFALSQLRRNRRSARGRMANRSIGSRIRALWDTFRWGILRGQWLRPQRLLSDVFCAAAYLDDSSTNDQLYIGTSMGLTALRGSDRHRLWHELLMMEITRIVPEQRRLS